MAELGPVIQGDVETLRVQLEGVDSLLGMSSIELHVRNPRSTAAATELTATVADASELLVDVDVGAWLASAAVGTWEAQFATVWADGSSPTFPNGKPDTLTVGRQLA